MEQSPHSHPAPASTDAGVPSLIPEAERQAALDAHGFDLAEFDWVPVKRKPRVDGWSAEKQRLFITTLADTGSVTLAARAVGMTAKSAYALRRAPDAAGFDRAWVAAVRHAMNRLIDVCMERALEGTPEPVWNKDGQVIGHKTRHHDRMAMFLLRAHMPELFGPGASTAAPNAGRFGGEAPESVAAALERLDPVPPAAPHHLLPPDELVPALQTATLLDGKLPRWRRDPDLAEPEPAAEGAVPPSLGEAFERELEAAKDGTWDETYGRPPNRARRRQQARAKRRG